MHHQVCVVSGKKRQITRLVIQQIIFLWITTRAHLIHMDSKLLLSFKLHMQSSSSEWTFYLKLLHKVLIQGLTFYWFGAPLPAQGGVNRAGGSMARLTFNWVMTAPLFFIVLFSHIRTSLQSVHQIVSFKTTFSKELQLLRKHIRHPLHRANVMASTFMLVWFDKAPFLTSTFLTHHFKIRSATPVHLWPNSWELRSVIYVLVFPQSTVYIYFPNSLSFFMLDFFTTSQIIV